MATTRSTVELDFTAKGLAGVRSNLEATGAAAQNTAARAAAATSAFARVQAATTAMGGAAKLSAFQITNLGYQLNDVASGLAMGTSPLTILAQQGGQVYQALGMGPGGVGGALRAIGNMLPGLAMRFLPIAAAAGTLAVAYQRIRLGIAEGQEITSKESLAGSNTERAAGLNRQIDLQEKQGKLSPKRAAELRAQVAGATSSPDREYIADVQRRLKEPGPNGGPMGSGVSNDEIRKMNEMRRNVIDDSLKNADTLSAVSKELYVNLNLYTEAQQKAVYKANELKGKADDDYRRAKIARDETSNELAFQSEEISLVLFIARKKELAIEGNTVTVEALTRQEEQLNQNILDLAREKDLQKAKAERIALEGELEVNRVLRLSADEELSAELTKIDQERFEKNKRIEDDFIKEQERAFEEFEAAKVKADNERARALEEELNLRQQMFDLEMATVNSDYTRTSAQKYDEQIRLINEAMEGGTLDRTQGNLMIQQLGPDPTSLLDQFSSKLAGIQDQWGTFQQQVSTTFYDTMNTGINAVSSGLANALVVTGRFGDALARIPEMILVGIVGAIIQMGIRWVATQVMMAIVGRATMAASIAASAPLAAAQSAIWAAPATLVTIATFGSAAAAAPAFIAGAQAITATTSVLSSLSGFEAGGFTGRGRNNEIAGVVHRNEFVVPADATQRIGIGNLEALASGGTGGNGSGGASAPVHIYFAETMKDGVNKAVQAGHHDAVLVDWFTRNKTRLGMRG